MQPFLRIPSDLGDPDTGRVIEPCCKLPVLVHNCAPTPEFNLPGKLQSTNTFHLHTRTGKGGMWGLERGVGGGGCPWGGSSF